MPDILPQPTSDLAHSYADLSAHLGHKRFTEAARLCPQSAQSLAILDELVRRTEPDGTACATYHDLSVATGICSPRVGYVLARLRNAGIIEKTRSERRNPGRYRVLGGDHV